MIRAAKVRAVAEFELLSTIRRKGFLIATFGMPVFLLAYGAVVGFTVSLGSGGDSGRLDWGVVSESPVVELRGTFEAPNDLPPAASAALELAESRAPVGLSTVRSRFRVFRSREAALDAVLAGELHGYFLVPSDWLASGEVELVRAVDADRAQAPWDGLGRVLRRTLISDRLEDSVALRVESPITERGDFRVDAEGRVSDFDLLGEVLEYAVPALFTLLLFVSLMMTNGYLLQAMATEKENRVVEVLLASANPDELLFGKLIGLGLAGLSQILVWSSMLLVGGALAAGVLSGVGVVLPWSMMLLGVPYFLATYFFIGSLVLATGSLGGNLKEAQLWSMVWSLLAVTPFLFLAPLIENPHGAIGRVLTWIPFSSAVSLLTRLTLEPEGVTWFERVGPLLLLLASIWVSVRIGARLFRIGLLLTGSRPSLRDLLRQARLG